jgi:phospholipase C
MNMKDPITELLQLLGAEAELPTPHIEVRHDNPLQRYLGEGACTLVQFGDDTYHCMVMVATSANLPEAVLASLFIENFQEGLTRNVEKFQAAGNMQVVFTLATMKTAVIKWRDSFDRPVGEGAVTLPFVVRWNIMGETSLNHATTFTSWGKNYTPEEQEEIARNFHALNKTEAPDDSTPLH